VNHQPYPQLFEHGQQGRPPKDKSVGVAFLLTLIFGPLGMFYVAAGPAILLSILYVFVVIIGIATLGVGMVLLFPLWVISMIWGCVRASRQHASFQVWLNEPSASTFAAVQRPVQRQQPRQIQPPVQRLPLEIEEGWYPDPAEASRQRW
jgi:hypothetical protein